MTIARLRPDTAQAIYQANLELAKALRKSCHVYWEGRRVSKRPILYTLRWARADTFIAHWYHGTSEEGHPEVHVISRPIPRTHPPVAVDWSELPALGKLEVVFTGVDSLIARLCTGLEVEAKVRGPHDDQG